MTTFVVVEAVLSGSPAAYDFKWWHDAMFQRVADYFRDVSGGRTVLTFRWADPAAPAAAPRPVEIVVEEPDQLTAAELVRLAREEVSQQFGLVDDEVLLVIKNAYPAGVGVTETDPTVDASTFVMPIICHEIGHYLQRTLGPRKLQTHACRILELMVQSYLDTYCVMGSDRKRASTDPVLRSLGPPRPPARDVIAPVLMGPAMANWCGWLSPDGPGVLDVSGDEWGKSYRLAPWVGTPPPDYEDTARVLYGNDLAQDGHEIFISWRAPNGWDRGVQQSTVTVHEKTPKQTLLIGTCDVQLGAEIRSRKAGFRLVVTRIDRTDRFGREQRNPLDHVVTVRLETTRWTPDVVVGGRRFPSDTRIAATSRKPGAIDVFVPGSDGLIRTVRFDGSAWRLPWVALDGSVAGPSGGIAAISPREDCVDLFVVGATEDAYVDTPLAPVYTRRMHGRTWGPWRRLAGPGVSGASPLAAVAIDANRTALFGLDPRARVVHREVTDGDDGQWRFLPTVGHGKVDDIERLWFGSLAVALRDGFPLVHAVVKSPVRSHSCVWSYDMRGHYDGVWFEQVVDEVEMHSLDVGIAAAATLSNAHIIAAAGDPLLIRFVDLDLLRGVGERVDSAPVHPAGNVAVVSADSSKIGIAALYVGADGLLHVIDRPERIGGSNVHVQTEPAGAQRLRSWNGSWVYAQGGGGDGIRADIRDLRAEGVFTVELVEVQTVNGGRLRDCFALRTSGGFYVTATGGGGRGQRLEAKQRHIDENAVFAWEVQKKSSGVVSMENPDVGGFQTAGGWYWCAEEAGGNAGVAPNREKFLQWETFTRIDAEL